MTIQTAVLIETLIELGAEVTLDELQHLLDAGPRRRRHRRRRRPRLRLEGRDARGVRLVHRAAAQGLQGRQGPEHDPRRRRRPHHRRPREAPGALHGQGPIRGLSEETTTGVHRLYEMLKKGKLKVPGHQRQRLGHQEQVRQPLRLPRVARRRHQARDRRDVRRQGRGRLRLRRRGQGLRAVAPRPRRARASSPRSTPSARSRPRWKATRCSTMEEAAPHRRHLRHRHRLQATSSAPST